MQAVVRRMHQMSQRSQRQTRSSLIVVVVVVVVMLMLMLMLMLMQMLMQQVWRAARASPDSSQCPGTGYAICWTASATMMKEGGPFWACL